MHQCDWELYMTGTLGKSYTDRLVRESPFRAQNLFIALAAPNESLEVSRLYVLALLFYRR
jgi:hypothetical protein